MSMEIQNPSLRVPMRSLVATEDVNATNSASATSRVHSNVIEGKIIPQINTQFTSERIELNRGAITNFSNESLMQANAACASFFGSVLALIQQTNSQLLRDNREISYEAQMQVSDSLDKQANTMRDKAVVSLVTGIVQGGLQIAGGLSQMTASIKAASEILKAVPAAEGLNRSQTLLQALSDPVQGKAFSDLLQQANGIGAATSQMMQGAGNTANALGSYFAAQKDADLQEEQANQKRLEAFAEQIKSINEAFKQTVEAAIENSKSISQSMVETNKRILV